MKITSLILILSVVLSGQYWVLAQNISNYEADLIIKKESSAEKKKVLISFSNETMNVIGKKDRKSQQSLPNSTIKIASYSYSERPQIMEGLALAILGFPGLPFLFNKKKKHWLIVSTEKDNFLFELNKDNYRQLLLEMNTNKIRVEDAGDRNYKPFDPRKNP